MTERSRYRPATEVAHAGRDPRRYLGAVNTPVFRASTILLPTMADLERASRGEYKGLSYGLHGLPTVTDLQRALATLEGGHAALAVPSGLTATTLPLLALLAPGDHLLVTDAVYGPTRRFCDNHLRRFGIDVGYYDPLAGAAIADAFRPNTKIVFTESPGSLTFEVQDIRAIADVAHARGARVVLDNTWATPLGFRAFDHGADVSVHAATKYIGGHSDVLLGAIVFTIGDALASGDKITSDELLCAALTFVAGIAAIAFLMNLLKRISFLPFVLYRMVLGGFLLVMLYS